MASSPLSVFVSSKMEELAPERSAIKDALKALEINGWVFEKDAGARAQSIQQTFHRGGQQLGSLHRSRKQDTSGTDDLAQQGGAVLDQSVLEQSVDHQLEIELGKEKMGEAIAIARANPWESVLELPNQARVPTPSDGNISDWFAEMDRHLLILGES
jgi:hypothetical protein